MVIITKTILNEFGRQHTDAMLALNEWYAVVKAADWNSLADIKQTFNSVDYAGNDRYIFNIKGNHYRIVAATADRHDLLRQAHPVHSLCRHSRPV